MMCMSVKRKAESKIHKHSKTIQLSLHFSLTDNLTRLFIAKKHTVDIIFNLALLY